MLAPTRTLALLVLASLAAPAWGQTSADENARRLAEMPLEQRQRLAENLERFDALDADEKARVRQLDRQLADLEPDERARYLGVLRRYHLWTRSLTDEQREKLRNASDQERIGLIAEFRRVQRAQQPAAPDRDWLQVSALNSEFLEDTAHALKVWFKLDDAEKAELNGLRDVERRRQRVMALGREREIRRDFRQERIGARDRFEELKKKIMSNPTLGGRFESAKPAIRAEFFRRAREALLLGSLEPPVVEPANLARFERSMPEWVREGLDPLPPEAARRRLQVLYRLVFPEGEEVPEPPEPTPAEAPTKKDSGERGSSPF